MDMESGEAGTSVDRKPLRVPKVIWILWYDGWDQAPELHQRCLESWQLYNLGWEVRAIARADLPGILSEFMPTYEKLRHNMNPLPLEKYGIVWIPPAAESDLLRLALLVLYGGEWVDSTMICRRPLDDWLPEHAATGFFAFAPESKEEDLPVMSSFLAAEKAHPIVVAWMKRVLDHWSTPSDTRQDLGFFWVHKLFHHVIAGDEESRNIWEQVPRVTGEYGVRGPHYFVKYTDRLKPKPSRELQDAIECDRETPMWKLTNHEVKLKDIGPESCYWVLLEATRCQAKKHASKAVGGLVGPTFAAISADSKSVIKRKLLAHGGDVGCF